MSSCARFLDGTFLALVGEKSFLFSLDLVREMFDMIPFWHLFFLGCTFRVLFE